MKTRGILYTDSYKKHSSDRVLSKKELRDLFGSGEVSKIIIYERRRLKSHKVVGQPHQKKKKKKEMYEKSRTEKTKSRVINI
jgi:hypothetical protein